MSPNPLLEQRFAVPFGEIRGEHVCPAIDAILDEAGRKVEAVEAAPPSFDGTLLGLEAVTERLENAVNYVSHLESVATTDPLRKAYNEILPKVSSFESRLYLREGLWKAVENFSRSPEAKALQGSRRRLLDKTLDAFKRRGAHLSADAKKRVEAIDSELSEITTKFSQNVLDATKAFELLITDPKRLSGLPESALNEARSEAKAKGLEGWRFTLQFPSYSAITTYADDASLREQLYRAYMSRCLTGSLGNADLVVRILALRKEKARLIGYADFADYALADRMAKTGAAARSFTERLLERTRPYFLRENAELLAFRREIEGASAPELQAWDVAYYAEKLRKKLYAYDEEELRPYFAAERVFKGFFEIVGRLYGIAIEEVAPSDPRFPSVWHEDVRFCEIRDEKGVFRGAFYIDLYPRDNKRGGAWMNRFITGRPTPEGFEPHLGVICGNLSKPIGGKPALLKPSEVRTIFHELGHLLHQCLSTVDIKSLSGVNVAWDFVELPSQIMENWCWEREALDLFARHYETGAPLPKAALDKLLAARNFRSGNFLMRQIGFGVVDLKLHTEYDPAKDGDVVAYVRRISAEFSPAPLPEDYAMILGFNHLFASPVGYAAGYYSYNWAAVLDADAFSRFQNEGIFNPKTGREFLNSLLSQGDAQDPMELFRAFMGREPDPDALLKRLGLV